MIGILTNGPRTWSSSLFRGWWLQDAAPRRIMAFGPGDRLDGLEACETVIFQKRQSEIDIERARRFKAEGRMVIYDLADPMWWWFPGETRTMIRLADCVTVSSPGLLEAVTGLFAPKRVECIPDRMLASHHPTMAQHLPRERTVLVWYGALGNRIALEGYLQILGYLGHSFPLEMRIIDEDPALHLHLEDMPHLPITNVAWSLETIHAQLADCDIAFLPPYPGPWGSLKSNNKAVTAWWAGLPVCDGWNEIEMVEWIRSPEKRREIAAQNRAVAERDYEIGQSVRDLLALAADLHRGEAQTQARRQGQEHGPIERRAVFAKKEAVK